MVPDFVVADGQFLSKSQAGIQDGFAIESPEKDPVFVIAAIDLHPHHRSARPRIRPSHDRLVCKSTCF
jgi:hypothetical protein